MSKLAKINEFIYNYRNNQLENTIKFLTDMEEFIKENEIIILYLLMIHQNYFLKILKLFYLLNLFIITEIIN